MFFVDCPDAVCTSTGRTITQIDATGGANSLLKLNAALECGVQQIANLSMLESLHPELKMPILWIVMMQHALQAPRMIYLDHALVVISDVYIKQL